MEHRLPLLWYLPADTDHWQTLQQWSAWPPPYLERIPVSQWQMLNASPEEVLNVAEVRAFHQTLAYQAGRPQVFVLLHVDRASDVAQQALLKVLEEPPANTSIFLTAMAPARVPVTIRSRCWEITITSPSDSVAPTDSASDQPTLTTVQEWWQTLHTLKDRDTALTWLRQQIHHAHTLLATQPQTTQLTALTTAYTALERNANVALTLEHLALSMIGQNDRKTLH
jgi:hypothetical protein